MSVQTKEGIEKLRTYEMYISGVQASNVSSTGVASECVWNTTLCFNVIDNLTVNVMHDVWEETCRYDLGLVINRFINTLFTIDILIQRITNFDFGNESNVPRLINIKGLVWYCSLDVRQTEKSISPRNSAYH